MKEIIDFLKENLKIKTQIKSEYDGTQFLEVQLFLGDEKISEDIVYLES